MDLIVSSPTTVALNPQQGAAVPVLKAGDIIEAQVLQLINDTIAKLGIGNSIIEVQTQVPLTPGTTVRLAVNNTPDGLRLTLLGNTGSVPGDAAPATTGAASNAASDVPPTLNATSVAAQAAVAAGEGADGAAAAQVANGGAAGGAAASAVATVADPLLAAQATPPSPVAVATAALAAAVQSSAARQNSLAPLLADASVAAGVPALPEPVRQAAERLLALQPTLGETLSADSIKQALSRSGLFLEAHLSAAADGGTADAAAAGRTAAAPGPGDDIKAALIVLRGVLKTWLATDTGGVGNIGTSPASAPPNPAGPKAQPLDLHLPLPNPDGKTADPRPAAAPPPPYRGAPTAAQPAAAPSITPDMTPHDIGKVLLSETDAALARQTLLQAASLPSQPGADQRLDQTGPRWNFEVPFMTPQGSAVVQFEIARDGRNTPAEGLKPVWRARFSLDVEPIGQVHAQIALIGSRAAVTLWAERPDTSARLRDNAPELADALRQAELDPGDVLVRAGLPPRPAEKVASGRFLDRAS